MREMKDSGIAWVGSMPSDWNVKRGKFTLRLLSRPIEETDEVITCFRDGEVTLRKNRREDGFTVSLKEIGYQGIEPGDLVVHGMDGFAGAIGISDSRGKSSPVLVVCDSDENKKYIMYYLRSMAYNDVFTALATGIRVRSCDLRWNKIAELPIILPSVAKQNEIVLAIDNSTAKIDALITNVQAQIEKLKAYKQSLITEVVTKGLDPSVPVKESGVNWAKQIPSTWSVLPIGRIMYEKKERTKTGTETPLSVTQAHGIILAENANASNPTASYMDWRIVEEDDIVFNKYKAHSGVFFVSPLSGIVTFNYSVYRCFEGYIPKYYEYQFKTAGCISEFRMSLRGVGDSISPLYTRDLFRIFVLCPPKEEQEQIVEYLKSKFAQIDQLIAIKQQKIDRLTEYKKSLIYEYVTGKREVS